MKKYTLLLSEEAWRKKRTKVRNGKCRARKEKKMMNDYEIVQIIFSGITVLVLVINCLVNLKVIIP